MILCSRLENLLLFSCAVWKSKVVREREKKEFDSAKDFFEQTLKVFSVDEGTSISAKEMKKCYVYHLFKPKQHN